MPPRTGTTRRDISRIFDVLHARALDNLPSLDELAALAQMSRFDFSRTFHAVAGRSLRDYLQDLRLKRSAVLLLTSSQPLTVIAQECGFYDLPHLDKTFRRRFGMTPHDFRRRGTEGVALDADARYKREHEQADTGGRAGHRLQGDRATVQR
jgi:transcriptional regulator GlxA family with amidase domain